MRTRIVVLVSVLALGVGAFAVWSQGQDQPLPPGETQPPTGNPVVIPGRVSVPESPTEGAPRPIIIPGPVTIQGSGPGVRMPPAVVPGPMPSQKPLMIEPGSGRRATASQQHAQPPPVDLANLTPLQKQMFLSAKAGADWLHRANQPDGRFVYGYLPALQKPLEGDSYAAQVGAALTLARAAAFFQDKHYAALAGQAVLSLLLETTTSGTDVKVRFTTLPSMVVNRLGTAGLLVIAIHELPNPGEDLLKQSDELCSYIRQQQQSDGSLSYTDSAGAKADPQGLHHFPGQALYALMRSQKQRPAAWKTEVVRKALPYYLKCWAEHKSMAFACWQSAAFTEAYLQTKERAFADGVFAFNDWLCDLQYVLPDRNHPHWIGGFMSWTDGKAAYTSPGIDSGAGALSLAEACRAVKLARDEERGPRYRQALERGLQFLTTLQYSEATTQHFAPWYRRMLVGGFYATHQDGTLRIDYNQHSVCALIQYLASVGDKGE